MCARLIQAENPAAVVLVTAGANGIGQGKAVEEVTLRYLKQNSLRTFVKPRDIANMALFLASDMGANISGQALGLDGNTESFAL